MAITFAPACSPTGAGVGNRDGTFPKRAAVVATSSSIVDLTFKRENPFFDTAGLYAFATGGASATLAGKYK